MANHTPPAPTPIQPPKAPDATAAPAAADVASAPAAEIADVAPDSLTKQLRAAVRKVQTVDDTQDMDFVYNGVSIPRELPMTLNGMPIQYHYIHRDRLEGKMEPHMKQHFMQPVSRVHFPNVPSYVFNVGGEFVQRGTDVLMFYDERIQDKWDKGLREQRKAQLEAIVGGKRLKATDSGRQGFTPGEDLPEMDGLATSAYYKQLFSGDDADAASLFGTPTTVS